LTARDVNEDAGRSAALAVNASTDPTKLIRKFAGDKDLLLSLIELFRSHAPQLLLDIQRGIESGDQETLKIAAHSLKGSISVFGATSAFKAATQLEAAARHVEAENTVTAFEKVGATLAELERLFDQIPTWPSE
jgi:HPt (histidine-containing phosphotransfer) domain-containing protein